MCSSSVAPVPENVHAEQAPVLAVKEHLEEAAVVAEDLAARDLAIARDADFVRNLCLRQRDSGLADHRDLRERVDPDRKVLGHLRRRRAERVTRGEPPLFARRRGQTRIADHVARREDVRNRGAELGVDGDSAAIVGCYARILQRERVRRAGAPDGEQRHVGDDPLARLEAQHGTTRRTVVDLERFDGLAETKRDVPLSHLVNRARRRSPRR